MTPAEEKEVEANAAGLQEVKPTSPPSDTSSEELPPFRKRSRRREILFISIAVVVGLGLIAVLVYFSAKNAIGEPEAVTMTTGLPSTTELYYYDEEYETGGQSEPHQQTRIANGGAGNSNLREAAVPTTPGPMARMIPGEPMARTNPGVGVARGGNIPPGGAGGVLRGLSSPTTTQVPTFGLRGNFPDRPTQHPDPTSQPDAPEQTNTEADKTKPPAVQTRVLLPTTPPPVEIKTTGKPVPPPAFKSRRGLLPSPPEETEVLDESNQEAAQSGTGVSSLQTVKVEPAEPIDSESNPPILPIVSNEPHQAPVAEAETKPSESNTIATDPPIMKPVTSPLVPPSAPTNVAPTTFQANGEAAFQANGASSTPIIGG